MEADLAYFRRRSAEETAAAIAAAHIHVRHVHLELAKRYDALVTNLEAQQRRASIRLVSAA